MPLEYSQKLTTRRKLLWGLLSLTLFLGLLEGTLHIAKVEPAFANRFFSLNRNFDYPEVFKRDRDLFWRLRPSQVVQSNFFESGEYRINNLGLRGADIEADHNSPTIAALGNSCTFGWQVPDDSNYLNLLAERLGKTGREVTPLNGGIPGYTSLQGRRFYESDISQHSPAVTLIMFGWNDQWPAANNIPDHQQQSPSSVILTLQNSVSRLRTYRLLRQIILGASEPPLDSVLSSGESPRRVSPDSFSKNITAICDRVIADGGIPVMLSSPIPDIHTYYGPGHYSPIHNRHELYNLETRRLSFEKGYRFIDLAAEFDRYDDLFTDARHDPIHFNAKGHTLVAELIYKELPDIWKSLEEPTTD